MIFLALFQRKSANRRWHIYNIYWKTGYKHYGGNVTINGGEFKATSKGPVIGTLVKNAYENDYKNITINNGFFGGLYNAVVFDEYTTATINQGNFEYEDYYKGKQAFGVVANGGKLTINGGNYYAKSCCWSNKYAII